MSTLSRVSTLSNVSWSVNRFPSVKTAWNVGSVYNVFLVCTLFRFSRADSAWTLHRVQDFYRTQGVHLVHTACIRKACQRVVIAYNVHNVYGVLIL